ncbi:hypothetical protein ACOMHN_061793 [Nucella lapillus]
MFRLLDQYSPYLGECERHRTAASLLTWESASVTALQRHSLPGRVRASPHCSVTPYLGECERHRTAASLLTWESASVTALQRHSLPGRVRASPHCSVTPYLGECERHRTAASLLTWASASVTALQRHSLPGRVRASPHCSVTPYLGECERHRTAASLLTWASASVTALHRHSLPGRVRASPHCSVTPYLGECERHCTAASLLTWASASVTALQRHSLPGRVRASPHCSVTPYLGECERHRTAASLLTWASASVTALQRHSLPGRVRASPHCSVTPYLGECERHRTAASLLTWESASVTALQRHSLPGRVRASPHCSVTPYLGECERHRTAASLLTWESASVTALQRHSLPGRVRASPHCSVTPYLGECERHRTAASLLTWASASVTALQRHSLPGRVRASPHCSVTPYLGECERHRTAASLLTWESASVTALQRHSLPGRFLPPRPNLVSPGKMSESSDSDRLPEFIPPLEPFNSTDCKIGGSIRPESSLQIYIKRRAPRDYVGFVDATSMAPSSTPRNRGVRLFNGLVNTTVHGDSQFLQGSITNQLEYLSHTKHGPVAKQLLLTETLPHHDYGLNIATIAECLSADSRAVRRDAASRLERLILVSNHAFIHAYKTHLIALAQKTYDVIHDVTSEALMEDQAHLRVCGHLHLLAISALQCRARHRPTMEECRPFMIRLKPSKKQSGNDVRQGVLKTMHAFYDCLERHLKDPKPKMAAGSDVKKFIKGDFCDQLSYLFLLLNQIADEDWNEKTLKLLEDLKELCDVIVKEGRRLKPEVKAGINALLIRCLVVLLNFTYAKVRQEVGGEGGYDQPVKAAQILTSVARNVHPQQIHDFLPRLSIIAYHENSKVRRILTDLLDSLSRPHLLTALDYLEASLGVADFHIEHPQKVENVCSWYKLKGEFGRRVNADCHVLIHAGHCKGNRSSYGDCTNHHPRGVGVGGVRGLALKKSGPTVHSCLVQVQAFQNSPFLFYATEGIKGRRLLEHLINHRAAHRWVSTSVLSRVMYDVISGLEFLASKHIASREIASYYLLVGGHSRRGGVASQHTDILTMEDCTVKLTSLGLSHHFRGVEGDQRRNSVRPVDSQGPIPLLWTPPEALLRGEYCEMSMVYSAGCVMYELWTHGCQPFTTYQKSTAETVRMMLLKPDSMPLIRWPCIPGEVYDLMRKCTATEPFSRPSLAALKQTFMEMQTRKSSHDKTEKFIVGGKEPDYPSFSDDQVTRKHLPELGIPPDVQQIIEDYKKNRNDSYKNMRRSHWNDYAENPPAGADREMNSPYWLQFYYLENFTSVREKLPPDFARKELPVLEGRGLLRGVTDWLSDGENQPTLEKETQDHIVHERRYRPAWTLLDAASKGMLMTSESGYVSLALDRYVHVLLSLTRTLHELHASGWLHRDLRASRILVDCQTGEVTLARLGRMCPTPSPQGCVKEQAFEDSWRWLGPEVLSDGEYSLQNDVFMLGTTIWEIFWCREVTERNPTATETSFLPFADQPSENILYLVRQQKALKKPEACPDWLHQLSINCRHPDPAMRPLTQDIIVTLEGELLEGIDPSKRFLVHPKGLVAAHERASQAGTMNLPALPARFQTKHARPFKAISSSSVDDKPAACSILRPVNLGSINLGLSAATIHEEPGSEAFGDYATTTPHHPNHPGVENFGYLTPASEEIKSVVDSKFQQKKSSRPLSESDTSPSEKAGEVFSKNKGRSVSESELSSAGKLDLNLGYRAGSEQRVYRKAKGYPSGVSGRHLPPVPFEDEESAEQDEDKEEGVYDEIKLEKP